MADVELEVQAEGVEDAVGEVPEGEAGGDGGDVAAAGGGGGRRGLGKLLAVVAGLLTFLEDILAVIGVVSSILRAFLAPVAVLLLRLLSPFLRAMIGVLPVWFDIVDFIADVAEKVDPLFNIFGLLGFLAGALAGASLSDLLSGFKEKMKAALSGLAADIGGAVANQIPTIGGNDGEGPTTAERAGAASVGGNLAGPVGAVGSVILQGGLSQFVERIDRDSGVESP